MATLRKNDLTARVTTKLGGSRAQGEAALNAVLSSVQEALVMGTAWCSPDSVRFGARGQGA